MSSYKLRNSDATRSSFAAYPHVFFLRRLLFRSRPGDARVAQHCALLPNEGERSVVSPGITNRFRQLFAANF